MENLSFGFIGGGQMCEAMLKGFLKAGITDESDVVISETFASRSEYMQKTFPKARLTVNTADTLSRDVVIIAVKPQSVDQRLIDSLGQSSNSPLFISIVAGATMAKFENSTSQAPIRLIRCMPNTPAMISESATAFCLGSHCVLGDTELAKRILLCIGKVAIQVPESQLNAVTGLSGSGPAFAFIFIEALADAGVSQGLPRDVALTLAAQTVVGAGRMILETGKHPAALKDSVCSPGGTTIAGVAALEAAGLRHAAISAVAAASKRSAELN